MKQPDIVNPKKRGEYSCKTVSEVFRARSWVIDLWETTKNSQMDEMGYDMFIKADPYFLKLMNLGGGSGVIAVQIKSSEKGVKKFVKKHLPEGRFFNAENKNHQFVLCGMDEKDLVLADIVGQLVVHLTGYDATEVMVIESLNYFGDLAAIWAYRREKVALLFRWYGVRLPPL